MTDLLHCDIALRDDRPKPFSGLDSPASRVDIGLVLFFVADHLTVQLVGQQVDGCIHVRVLGLSVQILTLKVNCHFGFLIELFDGEHHLGLNPMVEVSPGL